MEKNIFDIALIGAGAAGLHLALAFMDDPVFSAKNILILDKADKNVNDKTWCFWEKGVGHWDELTTHQWHAGTFYDKKGLVNLDMGGYTYKMLRSIDFYDEAKKRLNSHPQITWCQDEVQDAQNSEPVIIRGEKEEYYALHVFDSRIPPEFHRKDDSYLRLLQHFKGWLIETESEVFDPEVFTMMDFRLLWNDSTSFTYVLPISTRSALVEFTLFTPELIPDEQYDEKLRVYLRDIIGTKNYKVQDIEKGIIPMSNFPFPNYHQKHITKIGTAGGWVKPSSGYSFKFAEKFSRKVIKNLKAGKPPALGLWKNRFRNYDTLFLDILVHKNHLGPSLFSSMYRKNKASQIFKFLDEETHLGEEARLINTFPWMPFLQALGRQV